MENYRQIMKFTDTQLGSGVPRILESYEKECFKFSDNFLRMTFPKVIATPQDKPSKTKEKGQSTPQVTPQVKKLVNVILGEMSREEIQRKLKLSDKRNYINKYQKPAIVLELIEMTIPDKPNSKLQKYRLTTKGEELKKE